LLAKPRRGVEQPHHSRQARRSGDMAKLLGTITLAT
jgi:hypothetical protein